MEIKSKNERKRKIVSYSRGGRLMFSRWTNSNAG